LTWHGRAVHSGAVARTDGTSPRRALFTDERGTGLRASWHEQRGAVVLSLWREDVCVGTFQLRPEEAGRLAGFLAGHLGDAAERGERRAG